MIRRPYAGHENSLTSHARDNPSAPAFNGSLKSDYRLMIRRPTSCIGFFPAPYAGRENSRISHARTQVGWAILPQTRF
jgi:hypothetical protein